MRNPKTARTVRFINLAEQLGVQNAIVERTMESLVEFVSQRMDGERSDEDEIRKTRELIEKSGLARAGKAVPSPKLNRLRESTRTSESIES